MVDRYTSVPRPVLWLVPEGEAADGSVLEPFYLSTLPVTNRQLAAFATDWNASPLAPDEDDPAVGVELAMAQEYCRWYGALSRKAIRLPTEREWEHACRAGSSGAWFWGEDARAAEKWVWHAGNSGSRVPALASKASNGFGLYAMLGGVWEWVMGEEGRVLRGGSWRTPLEKLGCGERRLLGAGELAEDAGFRIARSLRG